MLSCGSHLTSCTGKLKKLMKNHQAFSFALHSTRRDSVREARDYFSFAFRVDLHHLLPLETFEYCIKKKLGKMLCLHPSNFKALKNKISLFACVKAREAYFAGSNTLSIELRVEISDEHLYKDKEAAIDHIHAVRGGFKKYGRRR
ncbi:hypothetical protein MRB53_010021 [Persea americana]|uniref:Uncharacterized protein n=1 Tax=Persea americana TaxID=3435 RepID=A0ACC2LQN5_PERAE|nr:hypothetical protein MRB53_010021 [Persea americana]